MRGGGKEIQEDMPESEGLWLGHSLKGAPSSYMYVSSSLNSNILFPS